MGIAPFPPTQYCRFLLLPDSQGLPALHLGLGQKNADELWHYAKRFAETCLNGLQTELVAPPVESGGLLVYELGLPYPLFTKEDRYGKDRLKKAEDLGSIIYAFANAAEYLIGEQRQTGNPLFDPVGLTVFGPIRHSRACWPMGARLSADLVQWLTAVENGLRPKTDLAAVCQAIGTAMYDMGKRLSRYDIGYDERHRFNCEFEGANSLFCLTIPGDACWLGGNDGDLTAEDGLGLNSHNLDTPIQAFTFLAGLAKLEELAREDCKE